ncbi:nucleoside triphosphate pyrophosphatase [Corynebacterium sp. Marseille-P3884]|uniref:Maf family protein n=1 Tax=Corynebacterium sp. Marseille-P3884 TaxID=2495409 RepID=UPI001B31B188|nr:nucleoside triphosphate pyrophosphatase [Corynebacterium sp. Marseille-P3884]MBP3949161.1 septum formation inhibitor Maf [Corynebacterium sp. Marseille-P3884]
MRLVLASQSPSRRMILDNAGVDPVQHPAHVDEDAIISSLAGSAPADVVSALARAKADAVAPEYPDDIVVGCDSMLLLNGQLQGKPHTVDETISRWRAQRGQTAELVTGHAIGYKGTRVVDTVSTRIHFGDATDADIEAYARSGEPLECAGAFTLEALGGWFIDSIEGDQTSVIGLSLPLLRKALYSFGVNASELWR